jgi:hypothetical protein
MQLVDAGVWDEVEAAHIRMQVFAATKQLVPSEHLFVENVFSSQAYAAILREFPTHDSAFRTWHNPGPPELRFGNYEHRKEIVVPEEAERLLPGQREFWSAMAALICGSDFARMLLERFPEYARARFGDQLDDPSFVDDCMRGTMILNRHDAGYYLGPHTDRPEKVFTCVLYFPESEGLDHLGTTIYRPLDPTFTCSGIGHHDPALFEPIGTAPYRPNSMLIFPVTDVMFHGVRPFTEGELHGSQRRGIQMQIWMRSERRREDCKVTLSATLPALMRAETIEHVPFQLTNRSKVMLKSEMPNATKIGYRWFDGAGQSVDAGTCDGAELPSDLAPGATGTGIVPVVAPAMPGRHLLRLSVVQDGVAWFDDIDPDNGVAASVGIWVDSLPSEQRNDILPTSRDVALGDGWFDAETHAGSTFRWASNDAAVHIAALTPHAHLLQLVVEPGPGLGGKPLHLTASTADGRLLGDATVTSRSAVAFMLPPERPHAFTVVLHVEGGGLIGAGDPRTLNFRALGISVEQVADVFPSWARPVQGFYPAERDGGKLMRWIGGNATIAIDRSHGTLLRFAVEPGPGFGSEPFTLRVATSDGQELVATRVEGRTTISAPLDALEQGHVVLRADGTHRVVAGDPRALDYRVIES